jgi:fused signal recognition particle receptor
MFKNWFNKKTMVEKNTPLKKERTLWQKVTFSNKHLDENLKQIKDALINIDIGVELANDIVNELKINCSKNDDINEIIKQLKIILKSILMKTEKSTPHNTNDLTSILVVGINGAGKTTTIGKLGYHFKQQQKSVIFAAGDTFRAAAIEQLKTWGLKYDITVIAQHPGSDSASVIFDAIKSAQSKNTNILIADTAGRLQTQQPLMNELAKVKKVMQKADPDAPTETWLIIDGTLGQNSLNQARQFHELLTLSGIIITKLDGTAKGGIIFSIAKELKIPVKFIGFGELVQDLQPFNIDKFIDECFDA